MAIPKAKPIMSSDVAEQLARLEKMAADAEEGWYSCEDLAEMAQIGRDRMRRMLKAGQKAGTWEIRRVLCSNVAGEPGRYLRWRPIPEEERKTP